jgi:photosystem II stability/assembly factor-like uncharacterized protein
VEVLGNIMYVGTTGAIYTSLDRGEKWTRSELPVVDYDVEIIEAFKGKLFVGTDHDLFMSTDAGLTWTKSNFGRGVNDFAEWNNKLYVATNGGGIYEWTETGNSWNVFNSNINVTDDGDIIRIVLSGSTMFAVSADNGVAYRFDMSSGKWMPYTFNGVPEPNMHIFDVVQNGSTIYALTYGEGIWRSDDQGSRWDWDGTDLRNDPHGILVSGDKNVFSITNGPTSIWIQHREQGAAIESSWSQNEEEIPYGGIKAADAQEHNQVLYVATNAGVFYRTDALDVTTKNQEPAVSIYPIPSSDGSATIRTQGLSQVVISDMSGRIVFENKSVKSEALKIQINAPGIYDINMLVNGQSISRRFQVL